VHGVFRQSTKPRELFYDTLWNEEERAVGISAIAAPIIERNRNDVIGALGVAGPTNQLRDEENQYPELVKEYVHMIEINATTR
jgi:DNA-binding IclR family transcriptional regulator